ncbi:SRPBCC family protein [Nocardia acidivorans]|uniref:SRPBCC family protein n=1 Tax=Nocardia acidivorans TaxID=404580 RepID=UPI00082B9E53|nr:SRPBCC domain-containing protein [Nocardia acidivorans]
MDDAALNPAAVEIGRFFARPPEVVWEALTRPEVMERWFARTVGFEAEVGTRFILVFPTEPPSEVAAEVLVARPGEQLTYSWIYMRPESKVRWVVDWTVQPQGRGTRLLLTQTGFDIEDKRGKMARNAMERGWRNLMPKLAAVIES